MKAYKCMFEVTQNKIINIVKKKVSSSNRSYSKLGMLKECLLISNRFSLPWPSGSQMKTIKALINQIEET